LKLLDRADTKGWKLFADVAAFCLPGRIPQIPRVKNYLPSNHLILGSDFPIPALSLCYREAKNPESLASNPLDRNIQLLQRMGLAPEIFTNANKVLSIPPQKFLDGRKK
jgi:hypothetical protein